MSSRQDSMYCGVTWESMKKQCYTSSSLDPQIQAKDEAEEPKTIQEGMARARKREKEVLRCAGHETTLLNYTYKEKKYEKQRGG